MRGWVLTLVVALEVSTVGGAFWFADGVSEAQVAAAELPRATQADATCARPASGPIVSVESESLDAPAVSEDVRGAVVPAALVDADPAGSSAPEGTSDLLEELRRAHERGWMRLRALAAGADPFE